MIGLSLYNDILERQCHEYNEEDHDKFNIIQCYFIYIYI